MLINIFRHLIVARAAELWLKRPYDDDIFMDYLYQMEILVLCAVHPGLDNTDRAAIRNAARRVVATLPALAETGFWKAASAFVLDRIQLFVKHGKHIASTETITMFQGLLAVYKEQWGTYDQEESDYIKKFEEQLADLEVNVKAWSCIPGTCTF